MTTQLMDDEQAMMITRLRPGTFYYHAPTTERAIRLRVLRAITDADGRGLPRRFDGILSNLEMEALRSFTEEERGIAWDEYAWLTPGA